MDKNVMIPLALMNRIIELLGYWDLSNYDAVIELEHFEVLRALNIKKRRLELRDDYAKIIRAGNQDDRDDARIQYLQNRCWSRYDEKGKAF